MSCPKAGFGPAPWGQADMAKGTVLDYPGLPAEQLLYWQKQAWREWALRPGPLAGAAFSCWYCPWEKQDCVRAALGGLPELPFQLEQDGTKVIFNYRR
jgi:hypothetical protein